MSKCLKFCCPCEVRDVVVEGKITNIEDVEPGCGTTIQLCDNDCRGLIDNNNDSNLNLTFVIGKGPCVPEVESKLISITYDKIDGTTGILKPYIRYNVTTRVLEQVIFYGRYPHPTNPNDVRYFRYTSVCETKLKCIDKCDEPKEDCYYVIFKVDEVLICDGELKFKPVVSALDLAMFGLKAYNKFTVTVALSTTENRVFVFYPKHQSLCA